MYETIDMVLREMLTRLANENDPAKPGFLFYLVWQDDSTRIPVHLLDEDAGSKKPQIFEGFKFRHRLLPSTR